MTHLTCMEKPCTKHSKYSYFNFLTYVSVVYKEGRFIFFALHEEDLKIKNV